ncbi:hypothetical protein PR003_g19975 [Phytophthora rubi]|uniref:Retroviral polymerase SH3-like domain-containing protein n=1 Tax=Phytophthora rubi TaxID=129364 RepID=A0A6A3K2I2_9STRA|nr:hypothetical protein PR001_g18422 [Phytophthora rubi]KAE9311586.1 hypothetical protein PR003_g19975 [Phytophthora rubi]
MKKLTGCPPSLEKMRTFGCQVLLPKSQRQNLDANTEKGVFLGYNKAGCYRFWIPSGYGSNGSIVTALTAVLFEPEIPKDRLVTMDTDVPIIVQVATEAPSDPGVASPMPMQVDYQGSRIPQGLNDPSEEKRQVHRSTRVKKKTVRRLEYEDSHNIVESALATDVHVPLTLQEAMTRPHTE